MFAGIVFIIIIEGLFSSCIMDRKESFCIVNSTKDTLMIELSSSDSLENWERWSKITSEFNSSNNKDSVDFAFNKAIVGNFALPGSVIYVDPHIFLLHDTCYIYTIKWNVAKSLLINEIRSKKLYDRHLVTKTDFHNHIFKYEYELYKNK